MLRELDCTQVFEALDAYAEAGWYAGDRRARRLHRHLKRCADCLQLYAGLLAALLSDVPEHDDRAKQPT